ncbi:MAG: hypothetical protein UZ05_CHB002000175 [Chlorobi bacterium OLB5]|nr:MAG: hypothetical protein UZ05_CHB002000175 [Chlorobi bacterium OLB5]
MTGYAGYFLLLNFGFISFVLSLMILIASILIIFSRNFMLKIPSESNAESKLNIASVLTVSMFTALAAGLPGTAKWQNFNIDYLTNNFSSVFSVYLPVLIAAALLASVIISTAIKLFVPGRAEH